MEYPYVGSELKKKRETGKWPSAAELKKDSRPDSVMSLENDYSKKASEAPLAVVKGMNYLFGKPGEAQAKAATPVSEELNIPTENYMIDKETGNTVSMNPDGTMRWSDIYGKTIARPEGLRERANAGRSTGGGNSAANYEKYFEQQRNRMSTVKSRDENGNAYFGPPKIFAEPEDTRYKWNTKDAKRASIDAASRERIAGMYGLAEIAQARALDEDTQMSPLRKEMLQKQFDYYNSIATEPEEEGVDPKSAIEELKKKLRKQI